MENDTSIEKRLDDEGTVAARVTLFKSRPGMYNLKFDEPDLGMEASIWLTRDELHTVSDLLLEGLDIELGTVSKLLLERLEVEA